MKKILMILAIAFGVQQLIAYNAHSADKKVKEPTLSPDSDAEQVNVDAIKEKYWARGEEAEIGVVQNRLYSKAHKFEFSLFAGAPSSDPFLSTKSLGVGLGYYFDEYFAINVFAWKHFVSPSSAYESFQSRLSGIVPTNDPKAYFGMEAVWSVLYGKLSLLGKKIIYFDLHLLGGIGETQTTQGTYLTPHLGVGQQIFLNKTFSLRADYRAMYYKDVLVNPTGISGNYPTGIIDANRAVWTHSITVGISIMFGLWK